MVLPDQLKVNKQWLPFSSSTAAQRPTNLKPKVFTNFTHFSQKLHLGKIGWWCLYLLKKPAILTFLSTFQLYAWVDRRPSSSMSGLQHPLEANGGAAGRATHIRFTPSVAGGGGTGATGNGSTAGAPAMAPPAFPPSAGPVSSSSGSYIRAGAPNIPPQPMSTSVPNVAEFNRNPLLCLLCNQAFQNPCLLACYHTFCAACLKGRVVEGKLACPLCG